MNTNTPSSLVIEYKSTCLIVRGMLSIVTIITLFFVSAASLNIVAIVLLTIWFAISLFWLKKAFTDIALIISDWGMKINDRHNIEWTHVDNFFIKTVVTDEGEAERLIINSGSKDFKFDIEDLNVDKERLYRWIQFYKETRANSGSFNS